MKLKSIITQAIDMHVHIGPEIIPRKYTAQKLQTEEQDKLAGCVLKNHFYPTAPLIDASLQKEPKLYAGLVLNNAVGGLNIEAIYASALLAQPLVVWLPTINAEQFLNENKYEIAPEWVRDTSLRLKTAEQAKPVYVTRKGQLLPQTKAVIRAVKAVNGVLATGHISSKETVSVALYARQLKVPVIITHPIYQHIAMSIDIQLKLAELGCYIEQCYSMYSMDGISIESIAAQIKAVGPCSVILSSDVGQSFSPSPSQALYKFAKLLVAADIPLQWIEKMMVDNPRKILKFEKSTTL
jgi:hypothetical protein